MFIKNVLLIPRIMAFFAISLCSEISLAQDGHYWSSQYGTTSNLLSGVVIGSVDDLGAVYYNPGHLAMIEDPSFLLSTKVYQLETITFEDALGANRDLKDSNFGGVPELLAVSFDIPSLPHHRFGFSLLTRRQSEFDVLARANLTLQETPNPLGSELINGEMRIATDVKEEWFGMTWSYKASPKVSFGLSNFFAQRSKTKIEKSLGFNWIESGNVKEALDHITPDVIVMDINMPDLDGIKATSQILSILPNVKIVALSVHSEEYYIHAMLKAGAMGFLLKNCVADELVMAIRKIYNGDMFLSSTITRVALNLYTSESEESVNQNSGKLLSLREQEILEQVALGLRNKEIAEKMHVSPETVKKHLSNIFKKLKVDNRVSLVATTKNMRI